MDYQIMDLSELLKHHFVQSEEIIGMFGGQELHYRLAHLPVPGSVFIKVYVKQDGWREAGDLIEKVSVSKNGVVHVVWKQKQKQFCTKVVCDYEYIVSDNN